MKWTGGSVDDSPPSPHAGGIPIHALKERSGGEWHARCGFSTTPKTGGGGGFTAWESKVTCSACIAARGPNQKPGPAVPGARTASAQQAGPVGTTPQPSDQPVPAAAVMAKLRKVLPG